MGVILRNLLFFGEISENFVDCCPFDRTILFEKWTVLWAINIFLGADGYSDIQELHIKKAAE